MASKEPFDPTPARTTLGEALVRMRGKITQTDIAARIPQANGRGIGIQRQALMELEGVNCPDCKGSGRDGRAYCSTCGGNGKAYKGNPTLERIEVIAREVFGVVPEVVFVYPPDHPLAGQIVTGIGPKLAEEAAKIKEDA